VVHAEKEEGSFQSLQCQQKEALQRGIESAGPAAVSERIGRGAGSENRVAQKVDSIVWGVDECELYEHADEPAAVEAWVILILSICFAKRNIIRIQRISENSGGVSYPLLVLL
jgi:hypothetical protein